MAFFTLENRRKSVPNMNVTNRYRRISPADLSRALDDLGLSAGQFARLLGCQRRRVMWWLEGRPDKEPAPHYVAWIVELLKLPGAMAIARQITDAAIVEEEES
jgi:hypothetical protein